MKRSPILLYDFKSSFATMPPFDDGNFNWTTAVVGLLGASVAIQALDGMLHFTTKKQRAFLQRCRRRDIRELRKVAVCLGPRPADNIVGPLLFCSVYFEFLALGILAWHLVSTWWLEVIVVLLAAGRFRRLQELGHHAIHGNLCPNRKLADALTNLLFQVPALKPELATRRKSHILLHHPQANVKGKDPNLLDFETVGMIPGISNIRFWLAVFYPLTPQGLASTLKSQWRNFTSPNSDLSTRITRLILLLVIVLISLQGSRAILTLSYVYLIPVTTVYPLFAWWSQVIEHRWFVESEADSWIRRECEVGRPTTFRPPFSWLIKNEILPFGDSYHLAHSLFPKVRHNFLEFLDSVLRVHFEPYARYESAGLFFSGCDTRKSAFMQLHGRLVTAMRARSFCVDHTKK